MKAAPLIALLFVVHGHAAGLVTPTTGAAMEGFDERRCKNMQQQADQIALANGRQPVLLGCTVQLIERERRDRTRDERVVCRDVYGRVECRRE